MSLELRFDRDGRGPLRPASVVAEEAARCSAELQRSLRAEACECGRPKDTRLPFCGLCYLSLPASMRRALSGTGNAAPEAVCHEAAEWLAARRALESGR